MSGNKMPKLGSEFANKWLWINLLSIVIFEFILIFAICSLIEKYVEGKSQANDIMGLVLLIFSSIILFLYLLKIYQTIHFIQVKFSRTRLIDLWRYQGILNFMIILMIMVFVLYSNA